MYHIAAPILTLFACAAACLTFASAETINVAVTPLVAVMHVEAGQFGATSTDVNNNSDEDERISAEPVDIA